MRFECFYPKAICTVARIMNLDGIGEITPSHTLGGIFRGAIHRTDDGVLAAQQCRLRLAYPRLHCRLAVAVFWGPFCVLLQTFCGSVLAVE